MEKELVNVHVQTLPNGYSLDFKGRGYMYYSLEALLEGFMTHVGLEELEALDAETMRDFITAAIVWKEEGSSTKQVLKLKAENEMLQRMVESQKKRIKVLNTKLNGKDAVEEDDDDDE